MESLWHYLSLTVLQVSVKFTVNGKKAKSVVAQSLGNLLSYLVVYLFVFSLKNAKKDGKHPGRILIATNCLRRRKHGMLQTMTVET